MASNRSRPTRECRRACSRTWVATSGRRGCCNHRGRRSNFAKLTPSFVWFCRYLSYNDPWLVAGDVLKRNVKIAADRPCPNSYNSNARFPAKARVQGTTLANRLVRNHQQGPDHFDDGLLRERSPRKQQENSTHLRRFHWVLEAP